jgi:hypothetical protein
MPDRGESEFRVVTHLEYDDERDGDAEWLTVLIVEPADEDAKGAKPQQVHAPQGALNAWLASGSM